MSKLKLKIKVHNDTNKILKTVITLMLTPPIASPAENTCCEIH